jgi:hypothetical protein
MHVWPVYNTDIIRGQVVNDAMPFGTEFAYRVSRLLRSCSAAAAAAAAAGAACPDFQPSSKYVIAIEHQFRRSAYSMAETNPLLPSSAYGRSRRIRTSAAVAAIGLLLALVLVSSLSQSKAPTFLESDGEHDSELIRTTVLLQSMQSKLICLSQSRSILRRTFTPCRARVTSQRTPRLSRQVCNKPPPPSPLPLLHQLKHFQCCHFYFATTQILPPAQQQRYAALLKEQDTERAMDNGFFRSGAGNPDAANR